MSDIVYQWPQAVKLYPDRGAKSYKLKRLRYSLRSLLHRRKIRHFTHFANNHADLAALLNQRPDYSYPIAHRFLDKRFNSTQRLQAVCDNLLFLPNKFAELGLPPLWQQEICFGEVVTDFALYLRLSDHQPMEGFWTLELCQQSTSELIYLLTFGKVQDALLISVIQGPNIAGSKEIVKQLTKLCYGLRPAYLMVELMKMLTTALGYQKLCGIPQRYQNKSRWVQSKDFFVDYDAIFRESGGNLQHYWQLPVQLEQRDLNQIESKKRSMYRKRYALLEQLQQVIQARLTGSMN